MSDVVPNYQPEFHRTFDLPELYAIGPDRLRDRLREHLPLTCYKVEIFSRPYETIRVRFSCHIDRRLLEILAPDLLMQSDESVEFLYGGIREDGEVILEVKGAEKQVAIPPYKVLCEKCSAVVNVFSEAGNNSRVRATANKLRVLCDECLRKQGAK